MFRKLSVTFWFILMVVFSHAQSTESSANALIDAILNSYHRDSEKETYPIILDSLKNSALAIGDKRAQEYIELVRVQHFFETTHSASKKSDFLRLSKQIFEETESAEVKAFYFLLRGQYAFGEKGFAQSLPFYLKAKKYLEEANYDSLPYATYFYNHFFDVYYYFEDYQSAAEFCEKALKKPDLDLYSHYGYYNNLGLCYTKLKNYKAAERAFRNGILASRKRNYKNFEALVLGNLGNLLRLQGKFKEALPLLYEESRINATAIPENAAISKLYIVQCLLALDSVSKAREFIAPPSFKMPVWSYPSYDLIKYETLALYYDKVGNFKLGGLYKDSLLTLKDTLKVRLDSKKLILMESKAQIENEREYFEHKNLITTIIIFGLLLLFTLVVFWMNNKRKQNQQKLALSLAKAKEEMDVYLRIINEKNDLIESLSSETYNGTEASLTGIDKSNIYLEELRNSIILTKDNWEDFKVLFEQLHPNFFNDIPKQYPDLTTAEIRLLALEKLDLPPKTIGNMLGVLPATVRTTKYRLRRKYPNLLGADTSDDTSED